MTSLVHKEQENGNDAVLTSFKQADKQASLLDV